MAKDGTIDVEFIGAQDTLLRYRVTVTLPGTKADGESLSAERFAGNKPTSATRLAFVGPPPKFEEIVSVQSGVVKPAVLDLEDSARSDGPLRSRWVVHVETSVDGGALVLKHPRTPNKTQQVHADKPKKNTTAPAKQVLRTRKFPQLIVGITDAPASMDPKHTPPGDLGLGDAASIAKVLEHIESRLRTLTGKASDPLRADNFEAAWVQEGGKPLPAKPLPDAHVPLAEEAWARQITEMLLLTPYGGSAVHYLQSSIGDSELIASGVDGTNAADPRYAIIYACQHLATFGIASRGRAKHRFPDLKIKGLDPRQLINAGSAAADTVRKMGGQWIIGGKPPKALPAATPASAEVLTCDPALETAKALYQINESGCELAPGAIFVYANRKPLAIDQKEKDLIRFIQNNTEVTLRDLGGANLQKVSEWRVKGEFLADNTAGAHAGFVLRTDPTGREEFQTFDTGGLFDGGHRGAGISVIDAVAGFHSGNFDDPPTKKVHGTDPHRGVGVWTKMQTADGTALDKHVTDVLEKARPLGFVRLVIVDGLVEFKINNFTQLFDAGHVLYASPLLRMWRDAPLENYSIARLIWSLRAAQCGQAKVYWWISIPTGPLARAMMAAPRSTRLGDLATTALASVKPGKPKDDMTKDPTLTVAKVLAKYTLPLLDLEAIGNNGRVKVVYKYPNAQKWHKLHFAERVMWNGKVLLPMDRAHIVGGQSTAGFPAYFSEF